jgi:hypothetical protein
MIFRSTTSEDICALSDDFRPIICEDTRGIIAERDGKFQAIVLFDHWSASSVSIHIKIDNPMVIRHGFLDELFNFVFESGRSKIIGCTPANNKEALKFIKHVGFEEVFRIKDGNDFGEDYVITEMLKENCKYGQAKST